MNKNYYDILQVNRNASPEIIEKSYKVLAKKYHPDLQPEEHKKRAEDILKEINEAYEVLSNPSKKQDYDQSLQEAEKQRYNVPQQENTTSSSQSRVSQEPIQDQEQILRNQKLQQELQYQQLLKYQQDLAYQQQLEQARQKAYHDAYIQDLKNRGYKIRYKKSFKDRLRDLAAFAITVLLLFLLWQIPFVKDFLYDFYQNNPILQFFSQAIK